MELQIFNYEQKPIRTTEIHGELWWVAKDVCDILELSDVSKAISRLDIDEKGQSQIPTPGGKQTVLIVNESGLYNLIIRSDKPEAKKFKKWVTSEVLPSIRKTGKYDSSQKSDDELILIGYEKLMGRVKILSEENKVLDNQVKRLVHDPKTYTTTEIAKELHMRSAIELNEKLQDKGIQYKLNNTWVLTSKYSGKDYTETKQTEKNGIIIYNTQWTGLGRQFILDLFPENIQRSA
jgi:anti-repressor protein